MENKKEIDGDLELLITTNYYQSQPISKNHHQSQ